MDKQFRLTATLAALSIALTACSASTGNDAKSTSELPSTSGTDAKNIRLFKADYPSYPGLEALVDKADLIVEATFESSKESLLLPASPVPGDTTNPLSGTNVSKESLEAAGVPVTLSTMSVTQTFKGNLKVGDSFVLSQTGGKSSDGIIMLESDTASAPEVIEDTDVKAFILVLSEQPNDTFTLLTPDLGYWAVDKHGNLMKVNRDATDATKVVLEKSDQTIDSVSGAVK